MTDNSTGERSPFNSWWWVAAGFLVAIAIVLGLILSGEIGAGDGNSTAPSGTSSAAPPQDDGAVTGAESTAGTPAADACAATADSQSIPTTGPAATWQTDVYFKYPTSTTFGPLPNPKSSEWGCFAHSPTGAVFAAANFFRGLAGADYESFAAEASLDSAARQEWLSQQKPALHQQTAGRVAQIAAFRLLATQPDSTVVSLGFQQGDVQATVKVALTWDAATDNWKADFAASDLKPVQADLSQYTKWAASNGG